MCLLASASRGCKALHCAQERVRKTPPAYAKRPQHHSASKGSPAAPAPKPCAAVVGADAAVAAPRFGAPASVGGQPLPLTPCAASHRLTCRRRWKNSISMAPKTCSWSAEVRSWALWSMACCTAANQFQLWNPTRCQRSAAGGQSRAAELHRDFGRTLCRLRRAPGSLGSSRLQRARSCGSLALSFCSRVFTWEPGTRKQPHAHVFIECARDPCWPQEDAILLDAHRRLGNRWTEISKIFGDR